MTNYQQNQGTPPHIRLTCDDIFENWKAGLYTPAGYLYHLIMAARKVGWWLRINSVRQFCDQWQIHERAFYRAKAKLIASGQLEERIIDSVEIRVPLHPVEADPNIFFGEELTDLSPQLTDLSPQLTDLSPQLTDLSPPSPETQNPCTVDESLRSSSSLSQTSLSQADESDDEELIEFIGRCNPHAANKRAYALTCLKNDREHWEQKYRLYRQRSEQTYIPPPNSTAEENCQPMSAVDRLSYYQAMLSGPMRGRIIKAIRTHPEWGLAVIGDEVVLQEPP
jgi:hypothetical protein